MSTAELFAGLSKGRVFYHRLGQGAVNILRTGNVNYLGPGTQMEAPLIGTLCQLFQSDYEMPLSYDLILQALRCLQVERDFKLAIVHAATAVEVHVLHLLHTVLVALGRSAADAWKVLENDPGYEGVSKRLARLDSHTKTYCDQKGLPFVQFKGGALYNPWKDILAHKRNRAVHAGVASFAWKEALEAIGIAKETVIFLDQRVPGLENQVQLNPSVSAIHESAGGILF